MKASLQRHDIDYPKTHDLVILLELFPYEKVGADEEALAYILSRFAVESRYSMSSTPPFDGRQMIDKTKKFAELIETLWDGTQSDEDA
jgi:HEPN domain-containing protein